MSEVSAVGECQDRARVTLRKGYDPCVLHFAIGHCPAKNQVHETKNYKSIRAIFYLCFSDCSKKKSVNTGKMSELQQAIATIKSDVDAVVLQQKVTDKKISNAIKSQEDLKDQMENAKVQREALSLEMVDLQLGIYLVYLDWSWLSITLL